jgi:hypothetical protein
MTHGEQIKPFIIALRRGEDVENNKRWFFDAVMSSYMHMELSLRDWVSVVDTFADHGNEIERPRAVMISAFFNAIKMSDTMAWLSDVNPDKLAMATANMQYLYEEVGTIRLDFDDMPQILFYRMRYELNFCDVLRFIFFNKIMPVLSRESITLQTLSKNNKDFLKPVFFPGRRSFRTSLGMTNTFVELAAQIESPSVLELGVHQSIPGRSTMHKAMVPHHKLYHGTDIEGGEDVDFLADIHRLSEFVKQKYDIVISCSTFEHLKYPHLAAYEISKCVEVGGLVFIQTHHVFPLHAYPHDYFRFSKEAMESLFPKCTGMEVLEVFYEFDCVITSDQFKSPHGDYLNTCIVCRKVRETEPEYRYELDTDLVPDVEI